MLTQSQATERSKAGVRRWYGENRDEYNALRRKRYAANTDEAYEAREKARKRAANYRKSKPTIERTLTRELNGKTVNVLSTGQVAELAKRSPQMLRNWETEGLIPASIFPDTHRLYTYPQARMVATLGRVIKRNGGTWDNAATKTYIEKIKQRW